MGLWGGGLRDTWEPPGGQKGTSVDIPPSAYGGGASTSFFPDMCLLLPGPGPLPSPHIFFPFASCLGLGCVGRVGGYGPLGSGLPSSIHPRETLRKALVFNPRVGPGVLEPRKS